MTIQELINKLQQFKPETKVFTSVTDPTDYTILEELNNVWLDENGPSGDNIVEFDESLYDDDGDYIGDPIVVIKVYC
jgi:hypothetical protein